MGLKSCFLSFELNESDKTVVVVTDTDVGEKTVTKLTLKLPAVIWFFSESIAAKKR